MTKLADDVLQCLEGKRDELFGRIQKATGETCEAVKKAIKDSLLPLRLQIGPARPVAQEFAVERS